jgi:anti-anti-sigma regulatory factor
MASNFRIYVQRNSDDLHIKLEGDFDGTSACQLLNVMKENQSGVTKIFIDTSLLDYIYPFGRDVFHNNLKAVDVQRISLLFTGDSSLQPAQEGNRGMR